MLTTNTCATINVSDHSSRKSDTFMGSQAKLNPPRDCDVCGLPLPEIRRAHMKKHPGCKAAKFNAERTTYPNYKQWNKRSAERKRERLASEEGPELRERMRELSRQYGRRLRETVLAAYGGVCVCCGEATYEFLAIDHVNNDGKQHRQEVGGGVYEDIKRRGFPPGFQVLCHNCNLAKAFYGECPHQKLKTVSAR